MKIIGLKNIKRKVIGNNKGDILKFLSRRDSFFKKFCEIYFTEIFKNKTKGWNYHKKNNCLLSVPYGKVQFWFIDGRRNSKSYHREQKIINSRKNYKLISVPPGVWFSFRSIVKLSIVANCIENPHSDNETLKSRKIKNHEITD